MKRLADLAEKASDAAALAVRVPVVRLSEIPAALDMLSTQEEIAAAIELATSDAAVPIVDDSGLACGDCGRFVPDAEVGVVAYAEPLTVAQRMGAAVEVKPATGQRPEPVTTCSACVELAGLAGAITSQHFPHGVVIDGLRYADGTTDLVRGALGVVAALGQPLPDLDVPTEQMTVLVQRLAPLGALILWSRQFAPHWRSDAPTRCHAPRPWALVPDEVRDRLAVEYGRVLAYRVAAASPPVRLVPPVTDPVQPNGCGYCGLDAVEVPATRIEEEFNGSVPWATRSVWSARQVRTGDVGGRALPDAVPMFLCPRCSGVSADSTGPNSLQRALMAWLDIEDTWYEWSFPAWAAVYTDARLAGGSLPVPSEVPWAHMGSRESILAQYAGAGGPRVEETPAERLAGRLADLPPERLDGLLSVLEKGSN